jgi:hypothetical protein
MDTTAPIILLGFLMRVPHQTSSVNALSPTTEMTPAATISSSIPADQKAFCEAVSGFVSQYQSAPNKLKKSAVRASRKQKLQELLPSMEFNGWVGRIEKMATTSKGNAYLKISLEGRPIEIETYNNELPDIADNILTPINSDLFNKVANSITGMMVKVSGHFLADKQDFIQEDFIKEISLTEEGSMTEPEFIVKFTQVDKTQ